MLCENADLVIAEIIPGAYDSTGRQVSSSFFHRKAPNAALPIGRYVSQPLTINCESIDDMRRFLRGCKPVLPRDLFGKTDYWQPPEQFEHLRMGDCVDFSLWTWRQLLSLGYDARFVGGKRGRYGVGHAWVEFFKDGKCFLVEPQLWIADKIPRLTTLRYEPKLSISMDGEKLRYFFHKRPPFSPKWRSLIPLIWEWLLFWAWFWIRMTPRLPSLAAKRLWHGKKRIAPSNHVPR